MIKAVLFDLDGTLVNSIEDLATSSNYALSRFGFPTHETECYKLFVGNGMQNLVERILPEDKRDDETKAMVFDVFYEHYSHHFADKTKAYNGIPELLKALKGMGLKLAVVSNKAQEMAFEVVDKILGADSFNIVCGKQEGYAPKPDPKLMLKVIKELGVAPQECVLIGDSGMDAAAAVNAGCTGIGVLWGFRSKEELLENGAHYIAENEEDIIEILKEIGL